MKEDDKRILKGQETRDNLIQAAVGLFSENGYDGTSVKDIADRAGVPKSLFYHYFKTKNELLKFLIESYQIQSSTPSDGVLNRELLQQTMQSAGTRVFDQLSTDQDMMRIIMQESLKDEEILHMFLSKFDEIVEGFSSIMGKNLREDVSNNEMKVFQLYFRFIPEILFLLTRDVVSSRYDIPEEELRRYFLKQLLQNPYLKAASREDNENSGD